MGTSSGKITRKFHFWGQLTCGGITTTQRFVAVTWDPESPPFWLTRDYFPEIYDIDAKRFPTLCELREDFPEGKVYELGIPENCIDGFLAAYWKRPEAHLNHEVRDCMSTFQKVARLNDGLQELSSDLSSGAWLRGITRSCMTIYSTLDTEYLLRTFIMHNKAFQTGHGKPFAYTEALPAHHDR